MPDVKDAYFNGIWGERKQREAREMLENVVSVYFRKCDVVANYLNSMIAIRFIGL